MTIETIVQLPLWLKLVENRSAHTSHTCPGPESFADPYYGDPTWIPLPSVSQSHHSVSNPPCSVPGNHSFSSLVAKVDLCLHSCRNSCIPVPIASCCCAVLPSHRLPHIVAFISSIFSKATSTCSIALATYPIEYSYTSNWAHIPNKSFSRLSQVISRRVRCVYETIWVFASLGNQDLLNLHDQLNSCGSGQFPESCVC